jgi:hypothetical protein
MGTTDATAHDSNNVSVTGLAGLLGSSDKDIKLFLEAA